MCEAVKETTPSPLCNSHHNSCVTTVAAVVATVVATVSFCVAAVVTVKEELERSILIL